MPTLARTLNGARPRPGSLWTPGSGGGGINPLTLHQLVHPPSEMPDPIEFVVSDKYLDRGNLYPRQATLLKVIFLREDMLTQFDYDVIGEWEEVFLKHGNEGVSPKILDRIRINRERGRPWFREVLSVIGRRGGKGHLGALSVSYVLWNYMHKPGGPQNYYGIDKDKRLTAIVFAGKKEQAVANQWRDLNNAVVNGPCFAPYISRAQSEKLTVFAPADLLKMHKQALAGFVTEADQATFEIVPAPATMMAGRGPASFAQMYDEMAHIVASGANRAAEEIYTAASPSLDQFGVDAFLYEGSSPWQMQGQFYDNWTKAIEIGADGLPSYPEMMMIQLPSWGPYENWEEADRIPIRPPKKVWIEVEVEVPRLTTVKGKQVEVTETKTEMVERLIPGPTLRPLKRAIQTYDDQMRQIEKANPETFAVERRSHWSQSLAAYLDRDKVAAMFGSYRGQQLRVQTAGPLSQTYKAHGDPSKVNDNFGWAIAHTEPGDESTMGLPHVVFDVIHHWRPVDFPDHTIDYVQVIEDIQYRYVKPFAPDEITFDQFNCLHRDSLVRTGRGLIPIGELADGMEVGETRAITEEVESLHGAATAAVIHRKGESSVLDLRTKHGVSLRCTPEHRVLVQRAKTKPWHPVPEWEWTTAGEVREGDRLRLVLGSGLWSQSEVDISGLVERTAFDRRQFPKTVTAPLARVMGGLVSEGSGGENYTRFSNSDPEVITAYVVDARMAFPSTAQPISAISAGEATDRWAARYVVPIEGKAARLMRAAGLTVATSQDKVVPWSILRSPQEVQAAFLSAVFEGDGGVTISDSAGEWVTLSTTSDRLSRQVQTMLHAMGILTTRWGGRYTYRGETRKQWRVKISGPDLLTFRDQVGFLCSRKMGALDEACRRVSLRGDRAGLRDRVVRGEDHYADRVVAILDGGTADCYDVSVPGPENFVADGVVVHNSVMPIGLIQRFIVEERIPKAISVFEKTATRPLNWKRAEIFKAALNMGLLHAPMLDPDGEVSEHCEMAELELRYLEESNGKVDHPSSGPIQHNDIADAMFECVFALIGEQMSAFLGQQLGETGLSGMAAGQSGLDPYRGMAPPGSNADTSAGLAALSAGARRGPRGTGSAARGMRRR